MKVLSVSAHGPHSFTTLRLGAVSNVAGKLFLCFIVSRQKAVLKIGFLYVGNSKEFGVTISKVSRKWYKFFRKINFNYTRHALSSVTCQETAVSSRACTF